MSIENPSLIHSQAMEFSFKAKIALEEGDSSKAKILYGSAAELETSLAIFYQNKKNLEPTRSIIIRSAVFLNIKAGRINEAQSLIFFGLENLDDINIKIELTNALKAVLFHKNILGPSLADASKILDIESRQYFVYFVEPILKKSSFSAIESTSVDLDIFNLFIEKYRESFLNYISIKASNDEKIPKKVKQNIKFQTNNLLKLKVAYNLLDGIVLTIFCEVTQKFKKHAILAEISNRYLLDFHNEVYLNEFKRKNIKKLSKIYSNEDIISFLSPFESLLSNINEFRIGYYEEDTHSKIYLKKARSNSLNIGAILTTLNLDSDYSTRSTIHPEPVISYPHHEFPIKRNTPIAAVSAGIPHFGSDVSKFGMAYRVNRKGVGWGKSMNASMPVHINKITKDLNRISNTKDENTREKLKGKIVATHSYFQQLISSQKKFGARKTNKIYLKEILKTLKRIEDQPWFKNP